jgi:hypothetical protein
MANAKTEKEKGTEFVVGDQTVTVFLPKLEEDKPGSVDQTVTVQLEGKNHNKPLIIQRGVRVEIPVWAFEILYNSGRFDGI